MDSSSNNNNNNGRAQPKESSSDQSSSNPDSSPPPPQPPHMAPPNMMYYPPGPGYPGHGPPPYPYPPQPYGPYPNEYPPHGYNNYPGGPYYGGGTPQNYRAADGGRGFIRGFIMCSCILFTTFFVASLVMALMLRPTLPVYKVSSLTVTNFNTNVTLTADWDINIAVQNPNERLQDFFSSFKVDVVHKNDAVAVSYIPDFYLDKKEEKPMGVKVSSSSSGVNGVSFQKWDLDELAMEQKSGSIMFQIRMSSMTAFKSTSLSTRSAMMLAICEGIKVVFQNTTGTMDNGGKPVTCQLYM